MLDREQVESLKQPLLGQLIITGSLVVGALAASVVIYFIAENRQFTKDIGFITMIGIAMAVGTYAAACIVPKIIRKNGMTGLATTLMEDMKGDQKKASSSTLGQIAARLTQSNIIRFALIEGTIFANLMFWFVEGSMFSWVVIGIGLAMMVAFLPLPNRAIGQIESMIDSTVEDARHSL